MGLSSYLEWGVDFYELALAPGTLARWPNNNPARPARTHRSGAWYGWLRRHGRERAAIGQPTVDTASGWSSLRLPHDCTRTFNVRMENVNAKNQNHGRFADGGGFQRGCTSRRSSTTLLTRASRLRPECRRGGAPPRAWIRFWIDLSHPQRRPGNAQPFGGFISPRFRYNCVASRIPEGTCHVTPHG